MKAGFKNSSVNLHVTTINRFNFSLQRDWQNEKLRRFLCKPLRYVYFDNVLSEILFVFSGGPRPRTVNNLLLWLTIFSLSCILCVDLKFHVRVAMGKILMSQCPDGVKVRGIKRR